MSIINEVAERQMRDEAIEALRAQVETLTKERDGYKQAADMLGLVVTQWNGDKKTVDVGQFNEPPWPWTHGIARIVNTLHSTEFSKVQATRILAYCIQSVLSDRLQWAGDEQVATTAPNGAGA